MSAELMAYSIRESLRRGASTVGIALAASLLLGACQVQTEGTGGQRRRAILILLDAARADRFTTNGYERATTPELAALAEDGAVLTRHYTQATSTRPALPTLIYSRYFVQPIFPYSRQIPLTDPEQLFRTLDDEAVSLPRALSAAGFTSAMISAHSWTLADSPMGRQFDQAHHLPDLIEGDRRATPSARQAIDYALGWIDDHDQESFFLYLHLMDPHFPHQFGREARAFLPGGVPPGVDRSRFDGRRFLDQSLDYSENDRVYLSALYDGSLRYTDRQLGRLFEHLRRRGWLDDTLIVVTADHGEHLLEHPERWEHGGAWYENVAHIPLIISYPSRLQRVRSDMLSNGVDVMPTMLGLLGVPLPEGKRTDGIDLSLALRGEIAANEFALSSYGALRDARYKCLFEADRELLFAQAAPDPSQLSGEIYDLEDDPAERDDLWPERPDLAARCLTAYRERLMELYRRFRASVTERQPEGPFAIASKHLTITPAVPVIETALDPLNLVRQARASGGWLQSRHWQNHQIFGRPGAEAIQVQVRVPNGTYAMALGLRGAARVQPPGTSEALELRSALEAHFDPGIRQVVEEMSCGVVDIQDQMLTLHLQPPGATPLLLRYIALSPLTEAGEEVTPEDADRLERLKALGYIG